MPLFGESSAGHICHQFNVLTETNKCVSFHVKGVLFVQVMKQRKMGGKCKVFNQSETMSYLQSTAVSLSRRFNIKVMWTHLFLCTYEIVDLLEQHVRRHFNLAFSKWKWLDFTLLTSYIYVDIWHRCLTDYNK